jgi:NAD(P)-dependent dehydrogenase (short-subunit alcohol dehydrogenase family)
MARSRTEDGASHGQEHRRDSDGAGSLRRPDRHRHRRRSRDRSRDDRTTGALVIGVDVLPERLDRLVVTAQSDRLITVAGDVADRRVIDQVVAAAEGRIDGLANVAGITDGFVPTAELEDEVWERVIAVNLTAVMRLTRASCRR